MKIKVEWNKPVQLHKAKNSNFIYLLDLDKIPNVAGIYIFARKFDKYYEALYVGKSEHLRNRVNRHLNNLKLMKYMENAKAGKRLIIIGQLKSCSKKNTNKALKTLERAFIRNFLVEGHDLANVHGIKIRRHEIISEGKIKKSFIPALMYLEK